MESRQVVPSSISRAVLPAAQPVAAPAAAAVSAVAAAALPQQAAAPALGAAALWHQVAQIQAAQCSSSSSAAAAAAAALPPPARGAAVCWDAQPQQSQAAQCSSSSSAAAAASPSPSLSPIPVRQRLDNMAHGCFRLASSIEESISRCRLAIESTEVMLSNHYRQKIAITEGRVRDYYGCKILETNELIERDTTHRQSLEARGVILAQHLGQVNGLRMELAVLQSNFQQSQFTGALFSPEAVSSIESRFDEIRRSCFR